MPHRDTGQRTPRQGAKNKKGRPNGPNPFRMLVPPAAGERPRPTVTPMFKLLPKGFGLQFKVPF